MAYEKGLADEIDWKILDQLESVVSKTSTNCFELKKLCITMLSIILPFIAKFAKNNIYDLLLITGLLIPFFFWLLDATNYYYQRKIRILMEDIVERINKRNDTGKHKDIKYYIIHKIENETGPWKIARVLFNHSMWLYFIIMGLDSLIWIIYKKIS